MHMISRKVLNSSGLETVTTSRCPTTVITANGEVQTHEEATVFVKELNVFLTKKGLEDTPAVLSLGELCDDHGYSYEWTNGQKPSLIKNRCSETMRYGELRTNRGHGLSTTSSQSSSSSAPPTSLPQESTGSAPLPASVECESADEQTRSSPTFNSTTNPKTQ